MRQRPFEDHHLKLRGLRFICHALSDGKSALYADLGETNDVQAKFPEVAARMARECRRRWDEIIASGRAFAALPEHLQPKQPKETKP